MPLPDITTQKPSRYVACDRDGTIIVERQRPLKHPDEVELIDGAVEGLQTLRKMGLGLVLITNQSGIGRGALDQQSLRAVHDYLQELLKGHGVSLDGIYVCPHAPWDNCQCRKPKPGLLIEAAGDLDVSPDSFIVIGDKASDLGCGKNIGASTILVRTGYGFESEGEGNTGAEFIVDDLPAAADVVQIIVTANNNG